MADPAPAQAVTAPIPEVGHQQCGRCRRSFEMELTTEAGTLPEVWFCADCRVALLGRPTRTSKSVL